MRIRGLQRLALFGLMICGCRGELPAPSPALYSLQVTVVSQRGGISEGAHVVSTANGKVVDRAEVDEFGIAALQAAEGGEVSAYHAHPSGNYTATTIFDVSQATEVRLPLFTFTAPPPPAPIWITIPSDDLPVSFSSVQAGRCYHPVSAAERAAGAFEVPLQAYCLQEDGTASLWAVETDRYGAALDVLPGGTAELAMQAHVSGTLQLTVQEPSPSLGMSDYDVTLIPLRKGVRIGRDLFMIPSTGRETSWDLDDIQYADELYVAVTRNGIEAGWASRHAERLPWTEAVILELDLPIESTIPEFDPLEGFVWDAPSQAAVDLVALAGTWSAPDGTIRRWHAFMADPGAGSHQVKMPPVPDDLASFPQHDGEGSYAALGYVRMTGIDTHLQAWRVYFRGGMLPPDGRVESMVYGVPAFSP